jgi:hypothetical protein
MQTWGTDGLVRRPVSAVAAELEERVGAGDQIADHAGGDVEPVCAAFGRVPEFGTGDRQVKIGELDCLYAIEVDIGDISRPASQGDAEPFAVTEILRDRIDVDVEIGQFAMNGRFSLGLIDAPAAIEIIEGRGPDDLLVVER